jgi:hypothetical protein
MNNSAIVDRTNQILRERIALGLTAGGEMQGGAAKKKRRLCASSKPPYDAYETVAYRCPKNYHSLRPVKSRKVSGSKRAKPLARRRRVVARAPVRRQRVARAPVRRRRVAKRKVQGSKSLRNCYSANLKPHTLRVKALRCPKGRRVVSRVPSKRRCISYETGRYVRRTSPIKCPKGSVQSSAINRKLQQVVGRGGDYDDMYGGCEGCPYCGGEGVLIGGSDCHACGGEGVMAGIDGMMPSPVAGGKRSSWIDFVKAWAHQNGLSYSQALRDHGKEVSRDYHAM